MSCEDHRWRDSHCLGRDIALALMPQWAIQALGTVVPMIREINEVPLPVGRAIRDRRPAFSRDFQHGAYRTRCGRYVACAKSHYPSRALELAQHHKMLQSLRTAAAEAPTKRTGGPSVGGHTVIYFMKGICLLICLQWQS